MCEGFVSTAKETGAYLNTSNDIYEMVVMTNMCSNGHINSIEVAVLCLVQKIMNEQDAWSSKMTIEIHARANMFTSLPPKSSIVLYGPHNYILFTPSILVPTAPPKNYKILIIIK